MPNVQLRDIVMYYEEAGSGDPLVLIPDLGGDLQSWRFQVDELSKQFRVVTPDNRGAGRTNAPDRPYTIAGMADDIASLLDELKIDKAHILGYGMGGYIAQEFALTYAARVEKLILLATAAGADGYSRAILESWIDVRRSSMSREQAVRHTAPWLYSADLIDDADRYARAVRSSLDNAWPQLDHAFIRQTDAILSWQPGERASGIKKETLIVAGQEDILVPPRNAEKLAKLIGGSTVKMLEAGHAGCIEYPNEYNAAFAEFLGA